SGNKSRSETIPHVRDMNNGINQESQWQIKPTERPIRRSEEPSERHERAKSTKHKKRNQATMLSAKKIRL
ncbi:hypothetical protein, partial [Flavitalea sp.]|nr:hypothetical protein [Flavitalea sp.]